MNDGQPFLFFYELPLMGPTSAAASGSYGRPAAFLVSREGKKRPLTIGE